MSKGCVVTGGANGIGRCIVEEFSKAGYKVAFSDVDAARGEALAQELNQKGAQAFFYPGDMAKKETLLGFARSAAKFLGSVDALINNACISKRGIVSGCTFEEFNYVLALGVTAAYMLCSLLQPHFGAGGSVVNIASTRAFQSQPDTESYTAAKGGISALTHALAMSLAGKARVNAVSPGWIDTGEYHEGAYTPTYAPGDTLQHPCGRVGHPKDIAAMCLFLCSEGASFITGQNFVVDGGMTKQMIYHNDFGWELHTDEKYGK
jgi:NAD(P)-dependent dehydrogenase (short-subunit alcohol dehydrogenase family)